MKHLKLYLLAALIIATIHVASSQDCPRICSHAFRPICGKNSAGEFQTFSNECKLRAKNCFDKTDFVEAHSGKCTAEEKGQVNNMAGAVTEEAMEETDNGQETTEN